MKFYIALLSLMLVIVLVFTAFGIPYAKNNFVGTVVTVEGYFNDFSGWLMNFYKTIHNLIDEWLPKIADTLKPLKRVIEQISLIVEDIYVLIKPNIENALTWWHDTFDVFSRHLAFFREYGFYILNGDWWTKYNYFGKIDFSSAIYIDGVYDWEKFEQLYKAYLSGNYTDEFSYIQYDYEGFLTKTFTVATQNYPEEYDIFVISREFISSLHKKSLDEVYNCLIAHDMPIVAFKVPKFTNLVNYFNSDEFLSLYSDRDFRDDYMTRHNFSIASTRDFILNDKVYEPLLINFVSSVALPDKRILVSCPINSYVLSSNALGLVGEHATVTSNSFDCSFLFKVENGTFRISGFDLYESVLDYNGWDDGGYASGDEAYPSVHAYFISSDILEYDYKGIFDYWIN